MINETLFIPEKPDLERDALATIWEQQGGTVIRVGKFWLKPKYAENTTISIYGNDTFSLVLAQVLGITLRSPQDELIAQIDSSWLKRTVKVIQLQEISQIKFPKFAKPVKPKTFIAQVYQSLEGFLQETKGIENSEQLILSDVVVIQKEVRSFILDLKIQDLAYYEGSGDLAEPREFIESFLSQNDLKLPMSYVLDIGFNDTIGWFIIEFNAAWGAGLNGCKPENVIDCIRMAVVR